MTMKNAHQIFIENKGRSFKDPHDGKRKLTVSGWKKDHFYGPGASEPVIVFETETVLRTVTIPGDRIVKPVSEIEKLEPWS